MKTILTLVSILSIVFLTKIMATSYAPPEDRVVKSPNGEYSLAINTGTNRHKIMKGNEVLWTFERRIWHDEFYLSNDGQKVLWVAWRHVQTDDDKVWINRQADDGQEREALVVYSASGILHKKTFAEVSIPTKFDEPGPIGDFWRVWRGEKITQNGDVISIPVAGKNGELKLDFSKISKP